MSFIQFFGSLLAVTIVALIAARLFPNKSRLTRERVINNTARYCPHINLGSENPTIFISEPGDTAVLIFPNHRDGVAFATALGDRVVIREITDTNQLNISQTEAGLSIDMDDFTQPTFDMRLPQDQRQSLLSELTSYPNKKSEPAHA